MYHCSAHDDDNDDDDLFQSKSWGKVALIPEPRAHVKNTRLLCLHLTDKRVGTFMSPDRTLIDMDAVAKEGRPKFNPRPGRGLNPGPSGC